MKPATGAVLRMFGYLIEILCLSLWLKMGTEARTIAGVPVRSLMLTGVFCGMAMIFASHFVKKTQKSRKPPRDFLK